MAKNFQVQIITPSNIVYNGEVESLIVPGEAGYLGVLADHAPLISTLKPGTITVKESSGQTRKFNVPGKGFIEVVKNQVTLLLRNLEVLQ
jgi:F-type H+-transporting ATPase subunit epsilon